jgi:hypothetical protein
MDGRSPVELLLGLIFFAAEPYEVLGEGSIVITLDPADMKKSRGGFP